jgi:predicted small secreted protein
MIETFIALYKKFLAGGEWLDDRIQKGIPVTGHIADYQALCRQLNGAYMRLSEEDKKIARERIGIETEGAIVQENPEMKLVFRNQFRVNGRTITAIFLALFLAGCNTQNPSGKDRVNLGQADYILLYADQASDLPIPQDTPGHAVIPEPAALLLFGIPALVALSRREHHARHTKER